MSTPSGLTPAQIAKAALVRLAQNRQEPTPENYRKAYALESGDDTGFGGITQPAPLDGLPPSSDDGTRWAELIGRIVRGAERGGRQWTAARKKESLQRVLDGSRSSATRLHQRLDQLVRSWDSDTLDSTLLEDDGSTTPADTTAAASPSAPESTATPASPTSAPDSASTLAAWPTLAQHALTQLEQTVLVALPQDQAQSSEAANVLRTALAHSREPGTDEPATVQKQLTQACEQAQRVIEHRHHLVAQLTELCHSLTDSLVDLSEDDSWVQGQCQAMRHQLDEGLHSRGVRHMQQLLSDTRNRQLELKREREAARQALKDLIHQMLQQIALLGSTTDRFQDKLGVYAETIGTADSLQSLAGIVREMVEESREVQSVVAQTQTRLQNEHARATELTDRVRELEDEIRKLSEEVSTDPLTQIANRRGMMRAFEAEQARVERQGTPLAVGLLDVDNFKKLNDQLGHQTGDEALKFLARRVSESLRPVDVVARYGGEEFVVMLPDTPLEEAQQVLTRLQRNLSAEFFTHDERKVFITFSAGVTTYRAGEAIEAALDRADVALYEAKRTGKNRTCTA
ncbi:MAG: diguanylate cyclase [Aquabacterium sp.]|jgi:diguanylate cyclase|uniref:GGDEF domain-containing protein n=1 Tax=Aquabacterium sp. TaxID=1872578 RepID=UPI002A3656D6|nr:diguanylate cyclase [Aquabacterium sp.]MDX9844490.1 diguanylate cyclase [Aquabacterium sp.]